MSTLYERASIIPGRSMTRSKAPGRMFDVGAGPMYTIGGSGAMLYGSEGREYIDMLCGLGAISLGYGPDEWTEAKGVYSLPHEVEVEAAEAVLKHVAPWASSVRFLKTGSEATHAAYRIAKAVTGRKHVFVGDWAYHGWHEWCSFADGAEESLSGTARRIRHNEDLNTCHEGYYPAAVFIEPHRWQSIHAGWLHDIRAFCDRVGALLVFDSMIYGGRFALGGASEIFGIHPDLECFGKALGNGASVAFIVGNQPLEQHGELVSGTYSGDVSGLSAVVDTLRVYTAQPVIARLWTTGTRLWEGLRRVVPSLLGTVEGAPVHQRVRFVDPTHGKRFAAAMAARGVLWHPDVVNVCYAHTDDQIARVIEAAAESVQTL